MATFLVTGTTSGIGAATAQALAAAGGHVIQAVRDPGKADPARGEIMRLDLADLRSIRAFADNLDQDVDVLINNAGVMGVAKGTTVDGFEVHFGVNHLGAFALTGLLLPRIRDRVVTVSSQGHRQAKPNFDDPHWRARAYRPSAAYAASKLANLLFFHELHRRLTAAGSSVRSVAAHPGLAQSNSLRNAEPTLRLRIDRFAQRKLGQSAADGARSIIYAAIAPLRGGTYVGPSGFYQMRGAPKVVDTSAAARNSQVARRLWYLSERDTEIEYLSLP